MTVSLKYAVVERERRYLVGRLPDVVSRAAVITDRYLIGTRLRLREVLADDSSVVRKLGHKVRLGEGPQEVACTSLYLDEAEWAALVELPARVLRKKRHWVERDGLVVVVDELADGTLLAEIDDRDRPPAELPPWLDVVREVSDEEAWTGAALAEEAGIQRAGVEGGAEPPSLRP